MSLKSEASEWVAGESDPAEFTADAVVEVVKSADREELNRIGNAESNGESRPTVLSAAQYRSAELGSPPVDDNDNDEDTEDEVDDEDVEVDEDYDPYKDPDVPSSAIAQVIAAELAGGEGSPTLDAVREAKK